MNKSQKTVLVAIIIIVIAASLVATYAVVWSPPKLEKITVALDWIIYGKYAMFYPAQKFGWYEDVGLDVTWLPGRGSADNIKRLLSGEVDVAIVSGVTICAAKALGVDIVAVASYHDLNPVGIFSRKGSGYTTLESLSGHSVYVAIGGDESRMVPLALQLNNITGVEIIEADFGTKVGGFISGDVEIISSYLTVLAGIWHEGIETDDILLGELGVDIYSNVFAVRQDYLDENRDAVRKFVEVTYRGVERALQNPENAIDYYMEYNPEWEDRGLAEAQFAVAISLIDSPTAQLNGYGYMTTDKWERTAQFCTDSKVIDEMLSTEEIAELFTNNFLP